MSDIDYLLKMVILGDACVGKSTLLERFKNGTANAPSEDGAYLTPERERSYVSTIGVDFGIRELQGVPNPISCKGTSNVRMQVWDTAGQERFRAITQSYLRGSKVIVVCFDVTNRSSLAGAVSRYNEALEQMASCWFGGFILVGLKCDDEPVMHFVDENGDLPGMAKLDGTTTVVRKRREVEPHEGESLARDMQAAYFELSNKYSPPEKIEELFTACAQQLFNEDQTTYHALGPLKVEHAGACDSPQQWHKAFRFLPASCLLHLQRQHRARRLSLQK